MPGPCLQTERYGAQKTCALAAGASETLRVAPAPKRLRTVAAGKGTWTERWGTAINLHFEGNWMPLLVCLTLRAEHLFRLHTHNFISLVQSCWQCGRVLRFGVCQPSSCEHLPSVSRVREYRHRPT